MTSHHFLFSQPLALWALLFVPVLFWFVRRRRGAAAISYSSLTLLESVKPSRRQRLIFIPDFLRLIALVLIVCALARPQTDHRSTEIISEGIDILLTIDTSGSMKALDFHIQNREVNRLEVVKTVVDDFIQKRRADRLGMVIFGENAYTQCPLTTDAGTLEMFLKRLRIGIVGDGTAIGNALATSVNRIKNEPTKSKIIILLTDGRNNAGEVSPLRAAEIAREFGIKVYTIGVGSRGPVPYPEETPFGIRRIYANLDLDEETLGEIATITGGQYFRATGTAELEEIYDTIDELEKSEIKLKQYHEYDELYLWFLIPALVVIIVEMILRRTVFMRIP